MKSVFPQRHLRAERIKELWIIKHVDSHPLAPSAMMLDLSGSIVFSARLYIQG